jgi:hypothetical protein
MPPLSTTDEGSREPQGRGRNRVAAPSGVLGLRPSLHHFERRSPEPLHVRKRDDTRQRFDRTKLRAALLRSTHKRQVAAGEVESLVDRVEVAIAAAGGELGAEQIAALCLQGLRDLDEGAYLQFLGTLPSPGPAAASIPEFAESSPGGSVRGARESSSLPAQTG